MTPRSPTRRFPWARTACRSRRPTPRPCGPRPKRSTTTKGGPTVRTFTASIPTAARSGNRLETDIYHDGRGDVVATQAPGGLVTTTTYDGAGRVTYQASGSSGGGGTVATVVQSVTTQYDGDGNPIFVTTSQLNPDGATYWTTYVGTWYNAQSQVTSTANYGTNGGTAMTGRVAPTAGVLVTSYEYDAGGFLAQTHDPTNLATTYSNDWLGRVSREVVNSTASGALQSITSTSYNGLNEPVTVMVQTSRPWWVPRPRAPRPNTSMARAGPTAALSTTTTCCGRCSIPTAPGKPAIMMRWGK